MAGRRLVVFDAKDLLKLLVHYTDGMVPLDAELVGLHLNPRLQRFIAFECDSAQWSEGQRGSADGILTPLHVRFTGTKSLKWGGHDSDLKWEAPIEAPKRQ